MIEATEVTGQPTTVYRFYDSADVLLYVGVTSNMSSRFRAHGMGKSWWSQVARKTMTLYGTRDEAEAEEARAILAENPVHNIVRHTAKAPKPARKQMTASPKPAVKATPLRTMPRRYSFTLSADFQAKIDAYAKLTGKTCDEAIGPLLLMGLAWFEDDGAAADTRAQLMALHQVAS